ncbi:MAG TPA: hypothetical protein VFF03_12065 [Rhodocyclaceae bacterium]|nr:hypothetical protein [Rhodocyclaceae bacterium]
MRYTAYGLSIDSQIHLPELLSFEAGDAETAEVTIHFGPEASAPPVDGHQLGPFLWVTPERLWLHVPRVARFLISNGNDICIAPEPGGDEDSIRVFLLGSVFGALLLQRGQLVLHGNAIRIGDQCMVCVGRSGVGKSTLAAGFLRRGYEILADDVVPVDNECRALPGFPRIKLWQDVADRLNIDTTGLRRIRPNLEKFNYPIALTADTPPLPIRWIYILNRNPVFQEIRLESIQGLQRFHPLHNNTYRVRFLDGMGQQPEHLERCGQLAGRVRLARVTRPDNGFQLDQLIDRLLADVAENP